MGVRVCTETECGQCTRLWACLSVFVMSVHVYNFCLPISFVCFKWHKCIVKRHTNLWGADKQPNTKTGFFSGYQGQSIVVILKTTRGTWHWKAHYMRMTRDNGLFQSERLSLAISSLPLNLKWGTGRRSGYTHNLCCFVIVVLIENWSNNVTTSASDWLLILFQHMLISTSKISEITS